MRKYRYEIKYIISTTYAYILKKRLKAIMELDKNSKNKKSYNIKSIYFDDLYNTAYYEKLDGVLYREKYRIRIYDNDDSFIRLERKLKDNDLTSKDGALISKDIYSKIINGKSNLIETNDKVLKRFLLKIKTQHLVPCVIVGYNRTAFTYPLSNVRITFDSDIRSSKYEYDVFNKNHIEYPVLKPGELVLEVKYDEYLPPIIKDIIATIPTTRLAVSKFALCRSIK